MRQGKARREEREKREEREEREEREKRGLDGRGYRINIKGSRMGRV